MLKNQVKWAVLLGSFLASATAGADALADLVSLGQPTAETLGELAAPEPTSSQCAYADALQKGELDASASRQATTSLAL